MRTNVSALAACWVIAYHCGYLTNFVRADTVVRPFLDQAGTAAMIFFLVSALRLIARRHCPVPRVVERRSRKRAGLVIRQRPRAGTTLLGGKPLTLVVSRGRRHPPASSLR